MGLWGRLARLVSGGGPTEREGVVALRRAVSLPVRFLGTGEGLDDLESFDARAYARRLVHE